MTSENSAEYGRLTPMLADLEALVRCESPSDDLAACRSVVALASEIADFNHTAEKPDFNGGSITAALFLEHFAGTRKWVHLDIAGPARSENDSGENPKGGTGFGVRLLIEWLTSL